MTKLLSVFTLACGLAGCAAGTPSPTDTRPVNDRTLPPGEGAFGNAWTWGPGKKEDPKPVASAPAAATAATAASASEQEEFKKWRESAGNNERQEFEEWRAWQEWKRKNPK